MTFLFPTYIIIGGDKMSCQCQKNNDQYFFNNFQVPPIIAPKKVCTTFQNQYVEQPIICPIECRRINNIIYVPKYYPRYEQTCYTQVNR